MHDPWPGEPAPVGLAAEALRLNLRYLVEVVEALDLCPFARQARLAGKVWRRAILADEDAALEPTMAALDAIEAAPPDAVEVALLVFPRSIRGLEPFSRFAATLQRAYEQRHKASRQFVNAVFHPDYALNAHSPRTLVGFLRKSPDAMLQYTRRSVLDQVKRVLPVGPLDPEARHIRADAISPTVERIARANYQTVIEGPGGAARLAAVFADHARDRAESYVPWLTPSA